MIKDDEIPLEDKWGLRRSESARSLPMSLAVLIKYTQRAKEIPSEIAWTVDAFLLPTNLWTLESATSAGLVGLLERLKHCESNQAPARFRLQRYKYGIRNAVKSGNERVLQWWADCYVDDRPALDNEVVFREAARHGHVHMLQRLRDEGISTGYYVQTEHTSVARWVGEEQELKFDVSLAAKTGDLEFIRWIRSRPNTSILNWDKVPQLAARNGHLELVRWMFWNHRDEFSYKVVIDAIEGAQLAILQWLNPLWAMKETIVSLQNERTDLAFINWMLAHLYWADDYSRQLYLYKSIEAAARLGQLDVLQAFVTDETFFPAAFHYNVSAMQTAATNGHLPIVKWLHGKGAPLAEILITCALKKSQLHVAQWLCEHQCGICTCSTRAAVVKGQVQALEWLHERGKSRISQNPMVNAAKFGHFPVVKWIHANAARSVFWWSPKPFLIAARKGHFEIARWLLESDDDQDLSIHFPTGDTSYVKLSYGNECTTINVANAMEKGRFALVEWLYEFGISSDEVQEDVAPS